MDKRQAAYLILIGSVVISALLIFFWLLGLVTHLGGALIHLLLLLALLLGFAGLTTGIVLLVGSGRK